MPAAQAALNAPVRASGIIWRIFPDEPAAPGVLHAGHFVSV